MSNLGGRKFPSSHLVRSGWVAVAILAGAVILIIGRIRYSWLPHDDGTLALAGQLVLRGQWPHVDFDTPYSGGLAVLNAVMFGLFGSDFVVMRYALVAVAIVALTVVGIEMTHVQPWPVVLSALAAAFVWSLAVYPTPMPSWYQVFLTLGAGAAFVRHLRTGSLPSLAIAGLIAGLAVIIKVTGFFALAALLLVLGARARRWALRLVLILGPVASAVFLVSDAFSWQRLVILLLPIMLVAAAAVLWLDGDRESGWREVAILAGSAIAPVAAYLAVSATQGDVGRMVDGWFFVPRLRFEFAASSPGEDMTGQAALIAVVLPGMLLVRNLGRFVAWSGLGLVLIVSYVAWWRGFSLIGLLILVSPLALGLALIARRAVSARQLVWLALLAFTTLLTFPASDLHYVLYLIPIAAVAVVEMMSGHGLSGGPRGDLVVLFAVVLVGVLALGVVRGAVYRGSVVQTPPLATGHLTLERASFEVQSSNLVYNDLIPRVREVAGEAPIYAGPDLPEVYALSGLEPAAPVFFDFLTNRFEYSDLPLMLAASNADAVVIHVTPYFSPPLPEEVLQQLSTMYPHSQSFDRFVLRWR